MIEGPVRSLRTAPLRRKGIFPVGSRTSQTQAGNVRRAAQALCREDATSGELRERRCLSLFVFGAFPVMKGRGQRNLMGCQVLQTLVPPRTGQPRECP